jgi:hypothetical protein
MDVMLWILLGLAGGLSVATLAPETGLPTRSVAARRRVRGAAAGLVGAVAAGCALVLAGPALRADRLIPGLGALAGALCFAGIAEAYASRRRRGEESVLPVASAPGSTHSAREMPPYDAAREALVAGLLSDAAAHEAGRYTEIGRGMLAVRGAFAGQDSACTPGLRLALRFWGSWSKACVSGPSLPSPPSVDWSRLARAFAADLALDPNTRDLSSSPAASTLHQRSSSGNGASPRRRSLQPQDTA